jgi:hypothetical protein
VVSVAARPGQGGRTRRVGVWAGMKGKSRTRSSASRGRKGLLGEGGRRHPKPGRNGRFGDSHGNAMQMSGQGLAELLAEGAARCWVGEGDASERPGGAAQDLLHTLPSTASSSPHGAARGQRAEMESAPPHAVLRTLALSQKPRPSSPPLRHVRRGSGDVLRNGDRAADAAKLWRCARQRRRAHPWPSENTGQQATSLTHLPSPPMSARNTAAVQQWRRERTTTILSTYASLPAPHRTGPALVDP